MQSRLHTAGARIFSILQPLIRAVVASSLIFPLLLSLGSGQALAIPLSDLVNGGSITQGDKVFNNFSGALDLQLGTFSPTGIGGIDVQGVTVPGMGGALEHGLLFSGPFSTSGSGLSALNYFIQYDVSVQNATFQINGLTTSLVSPANPGNFGEILLDTEVLHPTNNALLGVGGPFTVSPQSPFPQSTLMLTTAGLSSIRVNQDLVLFSEGGTVSLGGFGTTFSQGAIAPPGVIPEPMTLVLVGTGLLALALRRVFYWET